MKNYDKTLLLKMMKINYQSMSKVELKLMNSWNYRIWR